mmetsp:Transcript_2877/g.6016  ORF Transcript_2877/g.6016 Transcript_2877/m.6016 type:complete len:294 (+) Transcript_2877:426-1307(+)
MGTPHAGILNVPAPQVHVEILGNWTLVKIARPHAIHFHVRGPFCSGSNFVEQTLQLNGLDETYKAGYSCWKHTPPWLMMNTLDSWVYRASTLVIIVARHPLAWMASMRKRMDDYGIQCMGGADKLDGCRLIVSEATARFITPYCTQPLPGPSRLGPLEDIWMAYYVGFRRWASETVMYDGLPTQKSARGPVLIMRYEDMLWPSSREHLVRLVSLAMTGRPKASPSAPVKVMSAPAKNHSGRVSASLFEAVDQVQNCTYVREIPRQVLQRAMNSSRLVQLAHSLGYSLPCMHLP